MSIHRGTRNVTERIMMPTYIVVYGVIGLAFMLQRPKRTDSPHFDVPREIAGGSMRPWGLMFVVLAGLLLFALCSHRRTLEQWCLAVTAAVTAGWGAIFLVQGFIEPDVSFSTGMWVLGWTPCFIVSILSLDDKAD